MPAKKTKPTMSGAHKAALAEGRAQSRVVRAYLEALESNKPKRGRKRTPEGIKKRLAQLEQDIPAAGPLQRVQLIQERMDLESELGAKEETVDLTALANDFTKVAKAYSESKGLTYAAWRELGVASDLLKQSGISRAG
jgi:hypothetical protein